MAIPVPGSIPLVPGARDPQNVGALLENGGRTGHTYMVDAPPGDVVAFYAAHFAHAGEVSDGVTRWRFEETTTRAGEASRAQTVVSVGAGPDGKGTSLFIGAAITSEKVGTSSGQLGRDLVRGALRAVLASIGLVLLASAGDVWWSATPPLSAAYFGVLVVPCTALEAWAIRSGEKVSWGTIVATWVALVAALGFVHLQAAYASGAASTASFAGGVDALGSELRRLGTMAPGDLGSLVGLDMLHLLSVVVAAVATALSGAALAAPIAGAGGAPPTAWRWALAWGRILAVGIVVGTLALMVLVGPHPLVIVVGGPLLLFNAVPACGVMLLATTIGDAIAAALMRRR